MSYCQLFGIWFGVDSGECEKMSESFLHTKPKVNLYFFIGIFGEKRKVCTQQKSASRSKAI